MVLVWIYITALSMLPAQQFKETRIKIHSDAHVFRQGEYGVHQGGCVDLERKQNCIRAGSVVSCKRVQRVNLPKKNEQDPSVALSICKLESGESITIGHFISDEYYKGLPECPESAESCNFVVEASCPQNMPNCTTLETHTLRFKKSELSNSTTEACTDCQVAQARPEPQVPPAVQAARQNADDIARAAARAVNSPANLQVPSSNFNRACSMFINRDGSYGTLGRRLNSEFSKDAYSLFTDNTIYDSVAGVKELCPNFKNLSVQEKKDFWVWTFMSIAQVESTCGVNNIGAGVHTVAAGLFQLNAPYSNRRNRAISLRRKMLGTANTDLYSYCLPKDIFPHLDNTLCAMDIMLGHLAGQYGDPKLMTDGEQTGYWERLNRGIDGDIPELILEFQKCKK